MDFSVWASWHGRGKLDGLELPGIYALAVTGEKLDGRPFDWRGDIVYFGMTNSLSGLRGRLKQFDNTIIGKTGHGGAQRFLHDYDHGRLAPLLHVAVLPFKCSVRDSTCGDLRVMGRVAQAEYECWAKYKEIFGRLPKYNDKKASPKLRNADDAP